jgi:hypothetical protein
MAEFWRALKTLKALQAEQTVEIKAALPISPIRPAGRPQLARHQQPNEPERAALPRLDTLIPKPSRGLHESPAIWRPNEPEPMPANPPRRCREGRRADDRTSPALPE